MKKQTIDIGIDEKQRLQIAEGLKELFADSYTLYLQTHNFHWNVTGPQFRELHLMFEEQYKETEEIPEASAMLVLLTKAHEQVVKTCRRVLKVAQKANDESTSSLVSDRMVIHEKTAWMLRSMM
jgi:starvation-inducible DNA-binding protein